MAAKPTKVVVYFDDGTQWEVSPDEAGSIFLSESKAVKCGHKPPYKKPPKPKAGSPNTATFAALSTTVDESGGGGEVSTMEGGCYIIQGVIVCP